MNFPITHSGHLHAACTCRFALLGSLGVLSSNLVSVVVCHLRGLDRLKGTKILLKYGEESSIECHCTYEEKTIF